MRSLVLISLVAACSSSPDYGPPSSTTSIEMTQSGGFAPPGVGGNSVKITGTTAVYIAGKTETATISTEDVAAIIDAMQNIDFLDLKGDYSTCTNPATDAPTTHIVATVDAGSNDLMFYTGCSGGTFDDLAALEKTIFDLSGYTAWAQGN